LPSLILLPSFSYLEFRIFDLGFLIPISINP
jgi:hypothetical protein